MVSAYKFKFTHRKNRILFLSNRTFTFIYYHNSSYSSVFLKDTFSLYFPGDKPVSFENAL